ncbi:hypothetical protein DFH06DRAFT_1120447 [Mycena polygramma]|nr:hypothetical protein DFH06DRAFT_1120447 [Mycena polygramma]
MADSDPPTSPPTSPPPSPDTASDTDSEAALDAEIFRLASVAETTVRRHRDLDAALRNADDIHICGTCGITGHVGARATPSCPQFIVCTDCLPTIKQCLSCSFVGHRSYPLHWVKVWHPRHHRWTRRTLEKLGFVYQLGHNGSTCPVPSTPRVMEVIAANGTHTVSFQFCRCPGHREEVAQLLATQWFPARGNPVTRCVTYSVLGACSQLGLIEGGVV